MMLVQYNLTPSEVDELEQDFLDSLMAYLAAQANVEARKAKRKGRE